MTAKQEALAAIDRALSLMPKTGEGMTPLDAGLVRTALIHAGQCVGRIEELRRKRRVKKPKESAR